MRRVFQRGLLAATTLCGLLLAGEATAGGSGMPWEGPLQQVVQSITGPVVQAAAVVAVVIFGAGIAMSEGGSNMRRGLGILFGLSIAFAASTFFYQYLESGTGRIDLEKLDHFAQAFDADPFALLLAAQFGSSCFAVRAAGNKAAMVMVLALEQFNADAGDRLSRIDTASLLSAMTGAFRELLEDLERRNGATLVPRKEP